MIKIVAFMFVVAASAALAFWWSQETAESDDLRTQTTGVAEEDRSSAEARRAPRDIEDQVASAPAAKGAKPVDLSSTADQVVSHRSLAEAKRIDRLKARSAKAKIRLKVIDEEGELYDLSTLSLTFVGPDKKSRKLGFYSADDEGFSTALIESSFEGALYVNRRGESYGRGQSRADTAFAVFQIGDLKSGQAETLEILSLVRPSALVSGIAQDSSGKPVPEIYISVGSETVKGNPSRRGRNLNARTDEFGRFEIRGEAESGVSYHLTSSGEWHCKPKPFRPGIRDLSVIVFRKAGLAGKVSSADSRINQMIKISYRRSGSSIPGGYITRNKIGYFKKGRLRAGRYDLSVSVAGIVTRRFKGVELVAGQIAEPLELQDLVIEDEIEEGVLTLLDPDGNPAPGVRARITGDAERVSGAGNWSMTDENGEIKVTRKRGELVTLRLSSRKRFGPEKRMYRTRTIVDPTFPLTVQLETLPTLKFRLSRALPVGLRGTVKLALSRLRSEEEIAEFESKLSVGTVGKSRISARSIPKRLKQSSATLRDGGTLAQIFLREPGRWDLIAQDPSFLRGKEKRVVLLGTFDIDLEEDEVIDVPISDAMIEKVKTLFE